MVLIPGLAVLEYLEPTARALAADGWDVTLLRLPGWPGDETTARSDQVTSMRDLGRSVAAWLRQSGRADVVLVGQSIGTQVAAHAAAEAPGLVRSLVLAAPTVDPAYRSHGRLLGRWLRTAPHEPLPLAASQSRDWLRTGPRRIRHLLGAALDDELETTLRGCEVPRLSVLGERDAMCRPSWAAALSGRPLVLLPGAHAAVATCPRDFATALRAFGT